MSTATVSIQHQTQTQPYRSTGYQQPYHYNQEQPQYQAHDQHQQQQQQQQHQHLQQPKREELEEQGSRGAMTYEINRECHPFAIDSEGEATNADGYVELLWCQKNRRSPSMRHQQRRTNLSLQSSIPHPTNNIEILISSIPVHLFLNQSHIWPPIQPLGLVHTGTMERRNG